MSGDVFGIDLGTTYSAVAKINDLDQAEILKNASGADTTPSVLFFEAGGNVVVGSEAKSEMIAHPDDGCALIKRHMGTEYPLEYYGASYTPESLSALILKEMVSAANAEGSTNITKAVITVPAYFGVREKEATKQAGEIAGLEVVGILAEPIAAALSVGVRGEKKETLLVYDLGGGTFDTTVMIAEPGNVEVVAVDGNRVLGGADWDKALADLVVERFVAQAGIANADPSDDPDFMVELLQTVEEKKISLTKRTEATIRCRYEDYDEKIIVTRADFEQATAHLVSQTAEIAERTIETAKTLKPGLQIDKLILVGGSSRMPMVDQALRAKGWDPVPTEYDLAVAKGAAIYGQALLSGAVPFKTTGNPAGEIPVNTAPKYFLGGASTLNIKNVLSRGIGVRFARSDTDGTPYISFMVHANDSLPIVDEVQTAVTRFDNQSQVNVPLYEQGGEVESEEVEANTLLKEADITGLPPLPKGSPIELVLNINNEGLIRLTAREPQSGKSLELEAKISVLGAKEVEEAKELVTGLLTRS